jgi:hypothetical protein
LTNRILIIALDPTRGTPGESGIETLAGVEANGLGKDYTIQGMSIYEKPPLHA